MDTSGYLLHRLIEIDRACDRYEGSLSDGRRCEICLLREGLSLERLAHHLRLIELASAPAARLVLESDLEHATPFVALELAGQSAVELLEASTSEKRESEDGLSDSFDLAGLIYSLVSTVQRCHRVGIVIGGLEESMLTWSADHGWKVDITGLRSMPLDSTSQLTLDSSIDIYALGALVQSLLARTAKLSNSLHSPFDAVFNDCLAANPLERPTIGELATRLAQMRLGDNSRTIDIGLGIGGGHAVSGSSSAVIDATINIDEAISVSASSRPRSVGTFASGTRLGRYTIETKLGVGGMGAVYRARDEADNSLVAIKVLNAHIAADPAAALRFLKEARMLAKVNNPYVASLYDVNSEAEVPFMAFEYVEGGSLGAILQPGQPLDEKLALAIMSDAVRGLAVAHARGIVHRDFKPDNVLLTRAALDWIEKAATNSTEDAYHSPPPLGPIYAKVADFGLARAVHQSESLALTRDGALLGTPLYMSPEQCKGEPAGQPADVYSVGITLYQMLAGKPPFEADTQVAMMSKHCYETPPALKQLRPQLSEALIGTIEKCLAKNADLRYRNAGELLSDLENLLRGQPTSLGLHPPILSLKADGSLRFEHAWELTSSPAALWPYISNTDRVNHAIGLPAVHYTLRHDPVHGAERFAETSIAFQKIRWQEHPYEWIEGKRLSVLRDFSHGPFDWFVNVVELEPTSSGGSRVKQTFVVMPRNWLGKQLARLQLGKKSRDNFGRIYQQVDDYLKQAQTSAPDRDPFVGQTALRPSGRAKLVSRLEQLREQAIDPLVIDALDQFLQHASDLEVARIRPLALAERFQLDPLQMVNACLIGARCGLLTLLWDILCPSCRIPASTQETLTALKDHGYCEACDIRYAHDLSQSIELIFRVHPEIRSVETRTYCIGGPAWSKHVVAQVRLAPGERFACALELSAGSYVIRGPRLPFVVDFQVGHISDLSSMEISLVRPPQSRVPLQLQVGSQVIRLNNDSGQDQQIRIERTASRHDALSAAQASTMAIFRELFPEQRLSGEQIVSVMHITLMQVKIHSMPELYRSAGDAVAFGQIRGELERMLRIIKETGGAVVKTTGEGVLASFAAPTLAVAAAMELHRVRRAELATLALSVAIHSGSAVAATLDDRLDYFGTTIQTLTQILAMAPPGVILATDNITQWDDVRSVLKEAGASIELLPDSNDQISNGVIHRLVPAD